MRALFVQQDILKVLNGRDKLPESMPEDEKLYVIRRVRT